MTTGFSVLGWKGENGGFRKRLLYGPVFVKHTSPFSIVLVWTEFENKHKKKCVVDGRQRCENANVDVKLFMRFRGTET